MTLKCPDPGSPSIDHILPISKGGNDTIANVQLAHFECNWIKGDSEWKPVRGGSGCRETRQDAG